ncbi:TIGR00730 family Rossman fold protein [Siccirubricoccus sp. KC 17139]|uniref:Cytokinin riboside 5'-monophosphate phosphoribohydrolase n=1 Tax=Siccirubricoccus soli TaxID=2899147 RepID=A0ABT1DFR5_9PROT|nr:TIGR00730 family Rossman fold protein [Siccirubricoccus soli]MCP2686166.1 TIGR00730 family Rossman fold protein [Siccirubricoccus soli]
MPPAIRSAAVFCGSRLGANPVFAQAARALGQGLAARGITLVYGGGGIGLMGTVAEAAVEAGGTVRGIIPEFLTKLERPSPRLAEIEITDSMHSRKRRMFDLADAFVTLPGGLGTLDETVEVLTWRQLRLHAKPVIILDIGGWAQPVVALIDAMIAHGFVAPDNREFFRVVPDVPAALALLEAAPAGPAEPSGRL